MPNDIDAGYAGKVAVRRAVEAVRSAGIDIGAVELTPAGVIRIWAKGAQSMTVDDEFDLWDKAGKIA